MKPTDTLPQLTWTDANKFQELVKKGYINEDFDLEFCPKSFLCRNFAPYICDEHCYFQPKIELK